MATRAPFRVEAGTITAGLLHAGENRSFDSFKKLDESRLTRLENGCEIGGTSKAGANSPLRRLDPEALVEENHERDCGAMRFVWPRMFLPMD